MRLPYSGVGMLLRELNHAVRRRLQLRINPGVTRVEPDGKMPVLTPRGSSGLNDLLRRMCRQIFARHREPEISFVCCVANELLQKNRSFEPPVPKQFCVKRSDNDRLETEFADFLNLFTPLFQKVDCVFCCRFFGPCPVIQLFLIAASGDPMVFHSREFSGSTRDRSQM